jgi:hypothetical protein
LPAPTELLDVIADAPDAQLAEIREVLANLRGVEVKLLRQCLRRNRADARRVERAQASQIDRQTIGRQLGDGFGGDSRAHERRQPLVAGHMRIM